MLGFWIAAVHVALGSMFSIVPVRRPYSAGVIAWLLSMVINESPTLGLYYLLYGIVLGWDEAGNRLGLAGGRGGGGRFMSPRGDTHPDNLRYGSAVRLGVRQRELPAVADVLPPDAGRRCPSIGVDPYQRRSATHRHRPRLPVRELRGRPPCDGYCLRWLAARCRKQTGNNHVYVQRRS